MQREGGEEEWDKRDGLRGGAKGGRRRGKGWEGMGEREKHKNGRDARE